MICNYTVELIDAIDCSIITQAVTIFDSVIKQSNQWKFCLMEIYKDKHSLGGELHYIVYEADLIIIEE